MKAIRKQLQKEKIPSLRVRKSQNRKIVKIKREMGISKTNICITKCSEGVQHMYFLKEKKRQRKCEARENFHQPNTSLNPSQEGRKEGIQTLNHSHTPEKPQDRPPLYICVLGTKPQTWATCFGRTLEHRFIDPTDPVGLCVLVRAAEDVSEGARDGA